ncbi:MAG: UvrD-helicase domain-containing protein, partial [Firmicutes bacterium]|nr:UvrD-helicase domain-containing protein [Bacillota bacterium]
AWLLTETAQARTIEALLQAGVSPAQLRTLANQATRWRDLPGGGPCAVPDDRLAFYVKEAAEYWQRAQEDASETDAGVAQMRMIFQRLNLWQALEEPARSGLAMRLEIKRPQGNKKNWRHPQWLTEQKEWIKRLQDDVQEWHSAWSDYLLGQWLEAMRTGFLPAWRAAKEKAGAVTFDDLLNKVAALLRGNPQVVHSLQKEYPLFMVDEFQDTDPVQTEIIFRLAISPEAADWHDAPLLPGRLFLVGDPKQSIYRFRGADVETYVEVRNRLIQDGGDLLQITQNFRSHSDIIAFVNQVFAAMWPDAPDMQRPYVPPYAPLIPRIGTQEPASVPPRVIVDSAFVPEQHAKDRRRQEADMIAFYLRKAWEDQWPIWDKAQEAWRPFRWQDAAVIMPGRTGLDYYQQVLAQYGVPLARESGVQFFLRDEIRGFSALLSGLYDADDVVSIVAWLSSPWVGLTADELAAHAEAGYLFRYDDTASMQADTAVGEHLRKMAQWRRRWWRCTPGDILWEALTSSGLPAALYERGDDAALANVRKLEKLCQNEGSQWGNDAFAVWLRRKVDRQDREEEGELPQEQEAVHFSTVHRAKGLEWPVVVVANWQNRSLSVGPMIYDARRRLVGCSVASLQSSRW